MSYDLKISKTCDNKVVWDDHIVENDLKTVQLGVPISSSDVVVRVNDFKIDKDYFTEKLLHEDVSNQITGTNKDFYVSNGPIYDGLKQNKLAQRFDNVIVRIKVTEDVSEQFTGDEDYFYTQGKPLMKSNNFDFNCFVQPNDIEVYINNVLLGQENIDNLDFTTGKVVLKITPSSTDTVVVIYCFKAKIQNLDSLQSRIVLKELPKTGNEIIISYFSKKSDGWLLKTSENSLIERSQNIVFYKEHNTDRTYVNNEDVSLQFTGTEKSFQTKNYPILPLFQDFSTTIKETLNNAVSVYINGIKVNVAGVSSENGIITLFQTPKLTDIVKVSYHYKSSIIEPDRISVDFFISSTYCDKCSVYSDLIDYSINKLGNYEKVYDENKLIQDAKKIIRTILGSDPVAYWYGTEFDKVIGTKMFFDITSTKITDQIVNALSNLKSLQIKQEEYQKVTSNEFIDTISYVDVTDEASVPGLYNVKIGLITQSGKLVSIQETINTKG